MTSRCKTLLNSFMVAACLAAPMVGHAEETDPFGGKALKPGERYDGKMMTVDELVACIDLQRDLEKQRSEADSLETNVDLANSRLRGLDQIINSERQFLDRTDQHAIDAFNARIEEQSAAVDSYNDMVETFNKTLTDQDVLTDRFNAQCTTAVYYSSDLTKAYSIRERRLAASMAAGSHKQDDKP